MQLDVKSWQERQRRFLLKQGGNLLFRFERNVANASLVENEPFLDPRQFQWIADLESQWSVIREELDRVLHHTDELPSFQDISKDQYSITQDDLWKTYMFWAFGMKSQQNCERCPQTTRLIEAVPGMKTAFFSILMPGKHIPEHRGPYRGLVRYHLGLKVPEPASSCGIRVGGETRHWEEGKSLVFDDTYPHSAWNESDGIRVVLFLDFNRPLRQPIASLNKFVIQLISWSPYIRDNKGNFDKWDERLATAFGDRGGNGTQI